MFCEKWGERVKESTGLAPRVMFRLSAYVDNTFFCLYLSFFYILLKKCYYFSNI